jgi:ankyrin repeat protein
LISALELSKHSTTSHSPLHDAILFEASLSGLCDVVKCLLSSGADINLCDKQGHSPLFIASCKGECDVVECLLSSSADINLGYNRGQSDHLHHTKQNLHQN